MRVICQHCAKALTLADEKVPSHPFQLTCPACKKSFVVADGQSTGDAPGGLARSKAEAPSGPSMGEAVAPTQAPVDELPRLRPAERELLSSIMPVAYLVDLGSSPLDGLGSELERLGMEEIRRFEALDEALEVISDAGAGILVVRMEKASAPPCEPLEPLERLGYGERRRTFVVLVADNVKSLDGQVAFYLQVNCLINAQDMRRFAVLARRALLHHLRLYRHWTIESTS